MHVALYNMCFATLGGGERRTAALAAHLAQRHDVTLFVRSPIDASTIFGHFGIDIGAARIVALGDGDHAAEIGKHRPDLLINNSYASRLINPAPLGIYMCMFPDKDEIILDSYHVITANSHYTSGWIKRRWRYDAEVVYSACADFGPPLPKKKMILSVARFFADGPEIHHKRQDVLLDVFRRIADDGGTDWELHLIGSLGESDEDKAFCESLRARAAGYPVHIIPNADFDTLRDRYRRATIFWHGTGYGTTPDAEPAKQEHFGMTIVEAMSAGAIPDGVQFRRATRNNFVADQRLSLERRVRTQTRDASADARAGAPALSG